MRVSLSIKYSEMGTSSVLTAYGEGLVVSLMRYPLNRLPLASFFETRVVGRSDLCQLTKTCVGRTQDFASFDRAVPADLVAKFGDYVQFPIVGVALTMAYRLSEFNASDPNIVRTRIAAHTRTPHTHVHRTR